MAHVCPYGVVARLCGGPIVFTGQTHRDLPKALAEIGDDHDNKVLILTGTGDVFMEEIDGASLGEIFKPGEWDKIYWEGRRVLQRLLEIEAPIIAAANAPATVHSEYVLLADITVASEDAVFADKPHLGFGIVPGDGIHVIYEELLGVNRALLRTDSAADRGRGSTSARAGRRGRAQERRLRPRPRDR